MTKMAVTSLKMDGFSIFQIMLMRVIRDYYLRPKKLNLYPFWGVEIAFFLEKSSKFCWFLCLKLYNFPWSGYAARFLYILWNYIILPSFFILWYIGGKPRTKGEIGVWKKIVSVKKRPKNTYDVTLKVCNFL